MSRHNLLQESKIRLTPKLNGSTIATQIDRRHNTSHNTTHTALATTLASATTHAATPLYSQYILTQLGYASLPTTMVATRGLNQKRWPQGVSESRQSALIVAGAQSAAEVQMANKRHQDPGYPMRRRNCSLESSSTCQDGECLSKVC